MNQLNPLAAPESIPDPDNPVFGLKAVMPAACTKCRNRLAIIRPGKGAHAASLTCTRCRHARGWLAKQEADFINNIISTFGRPTAPIMLRSKLPASDAVRCRLGHGSSPAPRGHRRA
jgi:hypothetical protein